MIEHLYTVSERAAVADGFIAVITLNADDFIYKAHFPGRPITPGVCIIQILQELVEIHCEKQLKLRSAKNIKFLNILDPLAHPKVCFEVKCTDNGDCSISASLVCKAEDIVFAKMQSEFVSAL
jgi:3-hydroxyacyl-[acyl-carrier-protein] dehydratase